MAMRWISMLMVFILAGCIAASPVKVDAHFAGWRGHKLTEMIMNYGPPSSERNSDNARYALWTAQQSSNSPTLSLGLGTGGSHFSAGVGTTIMGGSSLKYCTLQALFDANSTIVQVQWQGDTDLCLEKFPGQAGQIIVDGQTQTETPAPATGQPIPVPPPPQP